MDPTSDHSEVYGSTEEVFRALEAPLLGYARRLLGDPEMAEETVQEAFLRLHREFDRVRDPKPWLYRTVHNLALNHRRKGRRIVAMDADPTLCEPPDPQPLPDEQIARMEAIGRIRLGLETLDARSRELLQLKFQEGLSYREMSRRTGLTTGHVGYLLHHALKTLAADLVRSGHKP